MGRFAIFFLVVLSVWTLMHAYVLWRVLGLPPFASPGARRWAIVAACALWAAYPLARILSSRVLNLGKFAVALDAVASVWIGVLFFLLVSLVAAEIATGFGLLFREQASGIRGVAVAVAGLVSVAALVQGLRSPEVTDRTVRVKDLRPELDGLVMVQVSDLHLGPLLGERWLASRVAQVEALRPDLVAVTGDVLDRDAERAIALAPALSALHARLGVYAVTGNHDYYSGLEGAVRTFEAAGFHVLRDRAALAAPGLVIAGVDDLTARRQMGEGGGFVERALSGRPAGATIYLSHSPSSVERAAELGADVMLSGHTHEGQIWPFGYLVRLSYPRLAGEYRVGGMTLVVSRGTGFWGPPMRFPHRGEIVKITLRGA